MIIFLLVDDLILASMKAPPKRKGNWGLAGQFDSSLSASMKAPPKRKGNPDYREEPGAFSTPQ